MKNSRNTPGLPGDPGLRRLWRRGNGYSGFWRLCWAARRVRGGLSPTQAGRSIRATADSPLEVDRQLRNIGLLTLLIAALGSVAVLSAEQHRSTLNALILGVAALAAVGSGGALVGGSVWFGVVRKDVAQVWNNLPHRRWHTSQRLAFDLKEEAKIAGADLVITVPNENAARSAGVPCLILELSPRRMHYSLKRPLGGSTITCEVIRGQFAGRESRAVEVPTDQEIYNSAVARFPDEWFNADEAHPLPGRYCAAWTLHLANSSTAHVSGRFRVNKEGRIVVGPVARTFSAARGFVRHFRGKD